MLAGVFWLFELLEKDILRFPRERYRKIEIGFRRGKLTVVRFYL